MTAYRDAIKRRKRYVWQGQARLGIGWALFTGCAGDNASHRHHAVQIALSRTGSLRVWVAGQDWLGAAGVIIGTDVQHRLAESDKPVTLLYLDGESGHGRAIRDSLRGGARLLSRNAVTRLLAAIDQGRSPEPAAAAVLSVLTGDRRLQARPAADAVIAASLAALPRPLPPRLTLESLARPCQLSPSRYAHRFAAHTGMALRPYLRWLRLLTAVERIAQGASLTDAAHQAGFSDSAHFSRTFRRHFGIAPRVLRELALSGVGGGAAADRRLRADR
jgi:AraC-like DNA-binding protein